MPGEPSCAEVEARLVEALLARLEPDPRDRTHAAGCPDCGRAQAELQGLRQAFDTMPQAEPSPELVALTQRCASAELARAKLIRPALKAPIYGLPVGFRRELARLLGGALAPLPLVLLWNLALLALVQRLLAGWVPAPLLSVLLIAYMVAAAGWIALVYGSIPLVAHQRVQRRLREVSP
jgi:hypothetical protein